MEKPTAEDVKDFAGFLAKKLADKGVTQEELERILKGETESGEMVGCTQCANGWRW